MNVHTRLPIETESCCCAWLGRVTTKRVIPSCIERARQPIRTAAADVAWMPSAPHTHTNPTGFGHTKTCRTAVKRNICAPSFPAIGFKPAQETHTSTHHPDTRVAAEHLSCCPRGADQALHTCALAKGDSGRVVWDQRSITRGQPYRVVASHNMSGPLAVMACIHTSPRPHIHMLVGIKHAEPLSWSN